MARVFRQIPPPRMMTVGAYSLMLTALATIPAFFWSDLGPALDLWLIAVLIFGVSVLRHLVNARAEMVVNDPDSVASGGATVNGDAGGKSRVDPMPLRVRRARIWLLILGPSLTVAVVLWIFFSSVASGQRPSALVGGAVLIVFTCICLIWFVWQVGALAKVGSRLAGIMKR